MLEIKSVTKCFGGLTALDKVSFSVQPGQIVGLIGPNGAGKTTLLNVIAGVHAPDRGEVEFMNERVTGHRPDQVCHKGIARTFQIPKPFMGMSVLENVMVGVVFGGRHGGQSPRDVALQTLESVGFPMSCETVAGCLNPLQLKRLDLARALSSQPRFLLLDEIAAGLRPSEYRELIEIIRRVRDRGVTILAVEHVLRVVMQICDRIVVLHYGEKIAEGSPAEIVENPQVIEAYLGKKQVGLAAISAARAGAS